jgi:hypothetical protein
MTPTEARERASVTFWGICYGTHHPKTGQRIVPSYQARKRLEQAFGVRKTLAEWREWARDAEVVEATDAR